MHVATYTCDPTLEENHEAAAVDKPLEQQFFINKLQLPLCEKPGLKWLIQ